MKQLCRYLLMGLLFITIQNIYAGSDPDHAEEKTPGVISQQKSDHDNKRLIEISLEGQQAAGIKTEILQAKSLPIYITAPGEAIPNMDLTAIITPRIQAQVVQRLVKIGDYVKQGQPLVRLSSVAMAKAQSELMMAYKEWIRAKKIKQQAIAAKYYFIAETTYQQKYSRLLSYGMTKMQINTLLKSNDPARTNGVFTLLAPRKGTIFSADFTEGQMVEAGKMLYKIVDETSLWVDAKLSNGESVKIRKGANAIIKTTHYELAAYVLQVHHKLDEITRTRVVRLDVPNPKDQLHPGEFVTCLIQAGKTSLVLAVHKTALTRTPDGDRVVYIEVKPNHFQAQEVQVIKKVGFWRIIKGIKPGVRIVTKGTFFVHSESLKGSFSKHNH